MSDIQQIASRNAPEFPPPHVKQKLIRLILSASQINMDLKKLKQKNSTWTTQAMMGWIVGGLRGERERGRFTRWGKKNLNINILFCNDLFLVLWLALWQWRWVDATSHIAHKSWISSWRTTFLICSTLRRALWMNRGLRGRVSWSLKRMFNEHLRKTRLSSIARGYLHLHLHPP